MCPQSSPWRLQMAMKKSEEVAEARAQLEQLMEQDAWHRVARVLLPHCLSPNAFEALVPHLQLTPREWAQVWPAFPKGEGETSALVVLLEAASRNRGVFHSAADGGCHEDRVAHGLVDAVVHLVVSGRTKVASFREAVAQAGKMAKVGELKLG
eukprot:Skav202166  [mRNA]  locus=scaffold970:393789:402737:- [translate_table: standard]